MCHQQVTDQIQMNTNQESPICPSLKFISALSKAITDESSISHKLTLMDKIHVVLHSCCFQIFVMDKLQISHKYILTKKVQGDLHSCSLPLLNL